MSIVLDPRDLHDLEALARERGKDPGQFFHELLDQARRGLGASHADAARHDEGESCYEVALRVGLIGCIKGGPSDLSTNPKYMEGFGED